MDTYQNGGTHSSFFMEAENCGTAILMIHGILGSPVQFESAAKMLCGQAYTVMGLLLPGHGGSARDFAKANVQGWQRAVREAVLHLKQKYERVVIVGHSLGGLLAVGEAAQSRADGVILLSTPMRLRFSLRALRLLLRVQAGNPEKDDDVLHSYRRACSVQKATLWTYFFWIPRLADLSSLMRKTKRMLMRVRCPVLVVQSRHDETVSWKSQRILAEGLASAPVEVLLLDKSWHSHFHRDEINILHESICRFVNDLSDTAPA